MPTGLLGAESTASIVNHTVGGGAPDAHTALSDSSDSTWVVAGGGGGDLTVNFSNPSLPDLAQIRWVKVRCRIMDSGMSLLQVATSPTGSGVPQVLNGASGAVIEVDGSALTTTPAGTPWTPQDLDNLHIRWTHCNCTEAWVVYEFNRAPTVTVTGPADDDTGTAGNQVTTTSNPQVTWTYSDPDGDPQERIRVKVFSGSAAVANPSTETARLVYDSGEVLSSAASHTIPRPLSNGDYVVAVQAADIGSAGRYSAWASRTFTMAIEPPPEPTVEATAEPFARVKLEVTVPRS
jgi:hypothetical protein